MYISKLQPPQGTCRRFKTSLAVRVLFTSASHVRREGHLYEVFFVLPKACLSKNNKASMPYMEVCVLLKTRLILPRISGRPYYFL